MNAAIFLILLFLQMVLGQNVLQAELPFEITNPIYTNPNDGYLGNPARPEDEARWYTDYSSICGIRGGYPLNRIVGGGTAEEAEFPWQVSLQLKTGVSLRHICGGTIIDSHWIITAGHCVSGISPMALSIVAGEYNLYVPEGPEQRRNVIKIFTHPLFDLPTFLNDIALLRLDSPLILSEGSKVAPICLPELGEKFEGLGTITGWGRLSETGGSPQTLQEVTIPLIDKYTCQQKYRNVGYYSYLHDCQLCAGVPQGGKDACQGDSGGPMICERDNGRYALCGIVSWGVGCARAQYPGVYTEVSCHVDWIHNVMQSNW